MSHFFVTGSADGLGRASAETLLSNGHKVVVHIRSPQRMNSVQKLLDNGATVVIGDLSDKQQVLSVASQVNKIGKMDGIIHNAGVYIDKNIMMVNVIAPYILTALINRPERMVYLSSSMHLSGHSDLSQIDFSGRRETGTYSDSKLFLTAFAAALSIRWKNTIVSSVDPGWVPTKMGGPNAPDDLSLGHLTQTWLLTTKDPQALVSGGYWHHQHLENPHPKSQDINFQNQLIEKLERETGISLPN